MVDEKKSTRSASDFASDFASDYSIQQDDMPFLDWNNLRLCGRDAEKSRLEDAYLRRKHHDMVLITGGSGSGKTVLAKTIQTKVLEDSGMVLSGMFHQHRCEPYEAFIDAFSGLVATVEERGQDLIDELRQSILGSGADTKLLEATIPALIHLTKNSSEGEDTLSSDQPADQTTMFAKDRQKRFLLAMRKLVAAICSLYPVVLVLENLMWADYGSLELVDVLVSCKEIKSSFLMIGTCRGDEVSYQDELAAKLRTMEDRGLVITEIQLPGLDLPSVGDMVSSLLHLPIDEALPLAGLLHRCTHGNAFFVMQFLQILVEERYLYFKDGVWSWKEDDIIMHYMAHTCRADIIELLTSKMDQLPAEVKDVLKVGACLGGRVVHESVLCPLVTSLPCSSVVQVLCVAEENGLIDLDCDAGEFSFRHHAFQEAAYRLIPENERQTFHRVIAMKLWTLLSKDKLEEHTFLIVDQFIQGGSEGLEMEEVNQIAELCLLAARKAAKTSAFSSAEIYVRFAMALLEQKRHWRDQYELSIELWNMAIELEYYIGNHESVDRLHDEILMNARKFEHTLTSYTTHINSLGTRGANETAIKEGIDVLKKLGLAVSRRAPFAQTLFSVVRIRAILKVKKDDEILNLPRVSDAKIQAALNILHVMFCYLFLSGSDLSPLIAMRIINLTFRHGLSAMSEYLNSDEMSCLTPFLACF